MLDFYNLLVSLYLGIKASLTFMVGGDHILYKTFGMVLFFPCRMNITVTVTEIYQGLTM